MVLGFELVSQSYTKFDTKFLQVFLKSLRLSAFAVKICIPKNIKFIKELETKISFAQDAFDIEKKSILEEKETLNAKLFELAKEVGKVELLTSKLAQAEKENSELKRMIENAQAESDAKKTNARKQEKLPLDREESSLKKAPVFTRAFFYCGRFWIML